MHTVYVQTVDHFVVIDFSARVSRPTTRKEGIPLSDQMTKQLTEGLEVAAQAAATRPDPKEASEACGQLITDQLNRGK
jgi:hypothetical protein